MKKRLIWILLSFGSLAVGALLYGLFRQTTHIGRWILACLPLSPSSGGIFHNLLSYHAADFLWSFSLTCALSAMFLPSKRSCHPLYAVAILYGVFWEILQVVGVLPGTGDLWDIVSYITAVVTVVTINYVFSKEKTT